MFLLSQILAHGIFTVFLISSYGAPLAQQASYLTLHSSLFGPPVRSYIVTNSINSQLIGSRCILNGAANLAQASKLIIFLLFILHIHVYIDDPVCIKTPCCPDSLTKILLDLFADKETSTIFYTTDLMVLIDIITRQLLDHCPGEKVSLHCASSVIHSTSHIQTHSTSHIQTHSTLLPPSCTCTSIPPHTLPYIHVHVHVHVHVDVLHFTL